MKKYNILHITKITLLAIFMVIGVTAQAQVTIGKDKVPEKFSVLELISNKKAGLRMPLLTTDERDALTVTSKFQGDKDDLAKGLTIYNTTINCLEYWNGKKWVSRCENGTPTYEVATNAAVTSCIPYMFTYQTMNLTASYTGATPDSYQWVVDGKLVPGATTSTYAYKPPHNLHKPLDDLGNNKATVRITCQMRVGVNYIQAADYEITVVQASQGSLSPIYVRAWNEAGTATEIVTFAHVNLGDENVTDPCKLSGYYFQWGRERDGDGITTGHFRKVLNDDDVWPAGVGVVGGNSSTIALTADFNASGLQVATGNKLYGKFIKNDVEEEAYDWRKPRNNKLWGDGTGAFDPAKTADDPCPDGWKVPSRLQWRYTFSNTLDIITVADAENNKWTQVGTVEEDGVSGLIVADALYLPAAGGRVHGNAKLNNVGLGGRYWSTSTKGSSSYGFTFYDTDKLDTYGLFGRALGFNVRCIKE
ncbi:hypothetical protein D0T84_10845 [Dysgonomonas sp. 521]|uniref:FISUMP domain-containing protein n=1 Tax=Dysgonomonas sp. 521 TaxID=2302932 RepID=UPI0013D3FB54|nr:FISUMP domain-containing protein [Dysgonomonas sp. 521]NDV95408.1 hypothetical protein [Dysgonomonas sp. 521]